MRLQKMTISIQEIKHQLILIPKLKFLSLTTLTLLLSYLIIHLSLPFITLYNKIKFLVILHLLLRRNIRRIDILLRNEGKLRKLDHISFIYIIYKNRVKLNCYQRILTVLAIIKCTYTKNTYIKPAEVTFHLLFKRYFSQIRGDLTLIVAFL